MQHKLYLYPLFIRLWHVLNALLCITLILTGLSMQYSSTGYPIIRFDIAVSVHNVAGVLLSVNYMIFLFGNFFTSNGKHYLLRKKGFFSRLKKQFMYYTFGVFKGQKAPFPASTDLKFNPLQQVTYAIIMYVFVPFIILSGFGLLFPDITIRKAFGVSGLYLTDIVHILSAFIVSVFLMIHIYFCTFGKTIKSDFKSMITGFHEEH